MKDYKVVSWRIPAAQLIDSHPTGVKMLDVDQSSHPDLVEHLADWRVVSHQFVPIGQDSLLLTLFMEREVVVPDTP